MPIQDAAFEHRMYLSFAAVVAGVTMGGWLAGRWLVDRGMIRPAVLPVVGASLGLFATIAFGMLTYQRNIDYRTALSIWQDTVSKSPKNDRALTNYGEALRQSGRLDEAIAQFEKALNVNPRSEVTAQQPRQGSGRPRTTRRGHRPLPPGHKHRTPQRSGSQ